MSARDRIDELLEQLGAQRQMSGRSLELLAVELVKCRREGPAPRASFPTMAERSSTTYAHALSSTKPSTSASSSLVRAAR